MRTTIDIHGPLLDRAKALAAQTGRRLADIVNEALAEMLNRHEQPPEKPEGRVKLPTFGGSGFVPGIDPRSNASYYEAMEERPSQQKPGDR